MELTARDVAAKTFHDSWRGYDQREVDDFLDRVAEALAAAESAAEEMSERVAGATDQARRIGQAAERRIAETEAAARERSGDELVAERRRLEASIARLERFRADLKLRLSAFLEGQARALEELADRSEDARHLPGPG